MKTTDVVIIGAGPYGLSIAAHLRAAGVDFRIFGSPMHTWLTQMPKGMRLKSEGFASSLSDPGDTFTLEHYCKLNGLPYADTGLPVPLETFISYGIAFQQKFVPELENKTVNSVRQLPAGFEISLEGGELVTARKLVMAVGISHFGYVPPILAQIPSEFVSHSSKHSALDEFKDREVVVVGAGASALDVAALLHQAGASVELVARKPAIRFHDPPAKTKRSLLQRIRIPATGIGSGWPVFFYANAPVLFHFLPTKFRLDAVRRTLGPAPGWFVKDQVVGKVPFNLGVNITQANVKDGRVNLELTDSAGAKRTLVTDHVIAATGYRVDLRRLSFMDPQLQSSIRSVEHTPVLSSKFESSVPGLYFVGTSSANAFGSLMRFAFGARFTAKRISKHLARRDSRVSAVNSANAPAQAINASQERNR